MKSGINSFVLLVAVIAGFGGFLFGYDSSVIADIQDQVMRKLSLSDWQWSQVVSYSLLGAVFGIPLSGLIADYLSRRALLKLVALGFILGTGLCAQATNLETLLIGRVMIGVCIGVASYVAPFFIAEIAPPKKRGSLLLINGLAITFGQAIAFLIGYFLHDTSEHSWRIILWIGVLPALVLFVGMFFVPHSPRWLVKRYGVDEARRVLKTIRSTDTDIDAELNEIARESGPRIKARFLLKPPILFALLVGTGLGVFQQFSGISIIMYYGPVIFQSAGFYPVKNAILATFWMGLVNFIFTAVTLVCVDRFGRRFLLLRGTLIAAFSLFAVATIFYWNVPGQSFAVLLCLTCYIIGYCISVGSLFWVIISEIYPLRIRGLAMSLATVMQWGANFLVSITFLEIFDTVGKTVTFSLFGLVCLLAYAFVYYFVPETTGVSLEEIEDNLAAGKKIRDIGRPLNENNNNKKIDLRNGEMA